MSPSQQNGWLLNSTAYALRKWQGKQAFVKENEKKYEKNKSKSVKFLRSMDEFFLQLMTFHCFKVASLI